MRGLFVLAAAALLAACANSGTGPAPAPKTVEVDLQRYQGQWYELARLPMFFQRNCVESEALYELQPGSKVKVTNSCTEKDGSHNQVVGEATPQVEGKTDKFWVRFDNWFSRLAPGLTKGHYWVLYVDDNYQQALVGHPEREFLWLLSRTPEVDQATRDKLLEVARERGYDTSELIWRGNAQ